LLLVSFAGSSCVGPDPPHDSAATVVERALDGSGGRRAGGIQKSERESAADAAAAEERRRAHDESMGRRREEIRELAASVLRVGKFADVRELWASSNHAAARGEFETSDEADQRRKEFASRLFFLDLEDAPKGSGQTVAKARIKRATEDRTSRFRYAMDRRALLVRVAGGFTGGKLQRLALFDEITSTTYAGRNAFGVRATVDRMVGDSYVVDLRNLNAFVANRDRIPIDEIREDWFAEAPMEPALVRDRLNNVKLLAVVKVDLEFGSWIEPLCEGPTFQIPYDTSIQIHGTSCWLEALVVYDGEDRTILQVVVDPTPPRSGA